jgi:myosin-crossreactive antigen
MVMLLSKRLIIVNKESKMHTVQQRTKTHITANLRAKTKAYLVGGGIASLASAVYLIRDGHMAGSNIYLFEESDHIGGSLDAQGSAEKGLCHAWGPNVF